MRRSSRAFRRLNLDEVTWRPDAESSLPESTAGLASTGAIIGQDRALKALRMGLEVYKTGYNVFVCGIVGTGRTTTVRRMLEQMRPACALADDLVYMHNFDEPERPRLVTLPRGRANEFRDLVHETVRILREEIENIINSDESVRRRAAITARHRERARELTEAFKQGVDESGFSLSSSPEDVGGATDLVFLVKEISYEVGDVEDLVAKGELSAARAAEIRAAHDRLQTELAGLIGEQQNVHRRMLDEIEQTERRAVRMVIQALMESLLREFPGEPLRAWTQQVESTILDNLEVFRRPDAPDGAGGSPPDASAPADAAPQPDGDLPPEPPDMSAFGVNVVLTNKGDGCPVIVENHPTHQNLFGNQDRVAVAPGVYGTDFTRIKPGSLLRAQGGYLILNAPDLLAEPGTWALLKRTLRSRELVIQPPEGAGSGSMPVLNPDPIELNVKVILLGSAELHEALHEGDSEFPKIFKVKADFGHDIDLDAGSLSSYVDVLVHIVREEGLADLDRGAIGRILQESMRHAGRRNRLSIRFSAIADVLREADYLARRDERDVITEADVSEAVDDRRERVNLLEERIYRRIRDGEIAISTEGATVGQANGLTVLSVGDYAFGMPSRLTCTTAVGKAGVVDIEREVELSGSSYEKGVMILTGFMNHRFAQQHALTLTASIGFEQSHAYVDGDSASSTEVYALMSSLASLPLRQDLAVTGSVDQFGTVQTVGGVNEKIEGFFDACAARGLTGTQGVVIPVGNVADLMLAPRVAAAVAEERFHVYPVKDIDEGIELLTGCTAGVRGDNGEWTPGSVNAAVQSAVTRLHELSSDSDD